MSETRKPVFVVLVGCNYLGERHEADDLVDNVPPAVRGAWLAEGVIRKATAKEKRAGKALPPADAADDDETDDDEEGTD